jgi:hypothetical protein
VIHRLAADQVTRLFASSWFVLDDIHRRSVETDVLIQRLIAGAHVRLRPSALCS